MNHTYYDENESLIETYDLNEITFEDNENNPHLIQSRNDQIYEECLTSIGFGKFHLLLLIVCTLANASDAIEILCISFILPTAQCDLKMNSGDKGLLSSMTFVGMMFGGFIWGGLGDVYGRKKLLMLSLLFNAIFAICCGLSQSFSLLIFFRFLSGIGIGGSIPLVWSYFIEFIPHNLRGRLMCCLASSWLIGNLLVILFAYLTLNRPDINFNFLFVHLNDWRIFMILCAVPSILSSFLLTFMPESPKFCLNNQNEHDAKRILRYIYSFNQNKNNSIDMDKKKKMFQRFDELKSTFMQKACVSEEENKSLHKINLSYIKKIIWNNLKQNTFKIIKNSIKTFRKPFFLKTIILLFISFSNCFGYYGLWIWLPELYNKMSISGGSSCSLNSIKNTPDPKIRNQTFECQIDPKIFSSTAISALSNLPGNIFTIFYIDKIGRKLIISISLIVSGILVFLMMFINNQNEGIIIATIFGGVNVITFNSLSCTTTELYPTELRSTSQGILYVASRIGAIFGNILFGLSFDTFCFLPLLTISLLFLISGFISVKLSVPNTINLN